MSTYFTGITFPQQKVTPSDDANIRRAVLEDGILSGCELSFSGYTLTMGAGLMIACGRQFRHAAAQNWAVADATSGYARLVLTIDTTRASTKTAFDQIVDSIEYASSIDGFSTLQQTDINESDTVYQIAVCVVSLGAAGITGIMSQLGSGCKFRPSTWRPTAEEIGAATPPKLLWENASPTSKFAAQAITLDLRKCEAVEIEFYTTTNASSRRLKSYRCPVGFVSLLDAIWPNGTATMQFYTRSVSVTEAGVAFTAASMWYEKGSTQGIDAEQYTMIPYRIYSIEEGV